MASQFEFLLETIKTENIFARGHSFCCHRPSGSEQRIRCVCTLPRVSLCRRWCGNVKVYRGMSRVATIAELEQNEIERSSDAVAWIIILFSLSIHCFFCLRIRSEPLGELQQRNGFTRVSHMRNRKPCGDDITAEHTSIQHTYERRRRKKWQSSSRSMTLCSNPIGMDACAELCLCHASRPQNVCLHTTESYV